MTLTRVDKFDAARRKALAHVVGVEKRVGKVDFARVRRDLTTQQTVERTDDERAKKKKRKQKMLRSSAKYFRFINETSLVINSSYPYF